MSITGKTILITGANRGIGQALVHEALARGAKRVYAGTRQPMAHPDERVTPLTLDVTNPDQVREAAERIGSLDVLVNNAGIARYDDLGDQAVLEQHLAVNLFGRWNNRTRLGWWYLYLEIFQVLVVAVAVQQCLVYRGF